MCVYASARARLRKKRQRLDRSYTFPHNAPATRTHLDGDAEAKAGVQNVGRVKRDLKYLVRGPVRLRGAHGGGNEAVVWAGRWMYRECVSCVCCVEHR